MRTVMSKGWKRVTRFHILLVVMLILCSILGFVATSRFMPTDTADNASAQTKLISQGQPAIASSVESVLFPPEAVVDGNPKTSWSSAWSDPQWIAINLGSPTAHIDKVELDWTSAYALAYQLQISNDGLQWTTVYTQSHGTGGTEIINLSAQGQYIRMYGIQRATTYGYALWSFNVYTQTDKTETDTNTIKPASTPLSMPALGALAPQPTISTPTPIALQPTPVIASKGGTSGQGSGSQTGTGTSGSGSSGTSGGSDPSGQAMPVGDLPGWNQVFANDFNTNVSLGDFPGSAYGNEFSVYADNTPDTAGQQGAPSRYEPSQVISVSNGLLNLYLHTANGTPMGAAILPTIPGNHLYGKYTVRFRSDSLEGFKVAWLLWPDDGVWPGNGEIDFPEGDLSGSISAFMHHQGATSGSDQDAYSSPATFTSWHTASIEWTPDSVNFILDGKSIGTSTTRIPDTPMHWVLQTESCLTSCPAASTAGNLQIDWVTAYTRS
jgi:hypothetical protein